jgi:DNA repair exonuclease SbcCD ATPase subunit
MIYFKTLRWKNFLSTGNLFTEIQLNKTTNTLIVGENGAGKSTILDALTYSLFGKAFRKVNKGQLINTITRKELVVEVEFDIGQNKYKIIRGQKPNVFEVYQNGSLMNQSAEMRDYQEILEKQIIKMNLKSFSQVVVLGSASFVPFMQLSASQRREVIEDLLDLQIFTTMNSLLKDKVQTNNEGLNDIAADQRVLMERIKLIKKHLQEKQNNNEKIVAEKVLLVEDTNYKIEKLNQQYWNFDAAINSMKEQMVDEPTIAKHMQKVSQYRHKIEAAVAIINSDLNFFNEHKDCPTCSQAIEESFRDKVVAEKSVQLNESNNKLELLAKEYDEANTKINQLIEVQANINTKQMEQFRVKSNIDSLIKYRDQLEKEIKNINAIHEADEEDHMTELEAELNSVAIRYNDAMDQKQIFTAASMLLKDGGIKAKIIKQYVPVINKLINKYLSAMDFFVQFELNEEFNETIKSRFRDEFSYASFSEGEKMRINLAILFTWRAVAKLRNSVSTNLLIMDEVFDSSLDSNGTEEFLKIIKNLTSDTNTFIISHKGDQLYDKFETVLKFEKKQNFSKVAA